MIVDAVDRIVDAVDREGRRNMEAPAALDASPLPQRALLSLKPHPCVESLLSKSPRGVTPTRDGMLTGRYVGTVPLAERMCWNIIWTV
jgi:hypothetical protein